MTYAELCKLCESGDISSMIEYDDNVALDEIFVEIEALNPHYNQNIIPMWVPESLAHLLLCEVDITETNRYYNYTSDYTRHIQNRVFTTESDANIAASKFINDLKSKYPSLSINATVTIAENEIYDNDNEEIECTKYSATISFMVE